MENKVTIVIPTYNRAQYVERTIESALAQTVRCNIIVCDNGSSDNTPAVMEKYKDRVMYIRREANYGPHYSWLVGVLAATTEYIHIHFDDDLMAPTFIEKTLALMSDDVGMVFTDADMYDVVSQKNLYTSVFKFKDKWKKPVFDSKYLEKELLGTLMISPAACLYRKKEVLDAIIPSDLPIDFGGYYIGVGSDLLMSLLACLRYPKCAVVTEALTTFGYHECSITIDSQQCEEKNKKLSDAYDAYRKYYLLLKYYKNNKSLQLKINRMNKKPIRFGRRIEKLVKNIGIKLGLVKKKSFKNKH